MEIWFFVKTTNQWLQEWFNDASQSEVISGWGNSEWKRKYRMLALRPSLQQRDRTLQTFWQNHVASFQVASFNACWFHNNWFSIDFKGLYRQKTLQWGHVDSILIYIYFIPTKMQCLCWDVLRSNPFCACIQWPRVITAAMAAKLLPTSSW